MAGLSSIFGILGRVGGMDALIRGNDVARATNFARPIDVTTVGAGTITADMVSGGTLLRRSGPGAAFTDTFPTAALLTAQFPEIADGDAIIMSYSNRVAFVATLAFGAGLTLQATSAATVAASASCTLVFQRTSATAWTVEIAG